jgi:integrase
MAKKRRHKTHYPGTYFELVPAKSNPNKLEKSFIISYRLDGVLYEERVGRESPPDDMTEARAFNHRELILQGKELSARVKKEQEKREKANTLSGLWAMYLESKGKELKGRVTDDNRFKKWIKPMFGEKQLKDIRPMDIKRLQRKMSKAGRKPQTIKHVGELLNRISNFAVNNEICEGLSRRIEHPKFDNKTTEDLTPEQLKKLLEICKKETINPDVARLVHLCACTGMRRSELLRLEWRDIDFENGFIHIRDPKGGASQKIPLNESARGVLEEQPKYDNSDLIFPNPATGEQRVDLRKTLRRIVKEAGLPKGFRPLHGLRHVYASGLASSGKVDMWQLQKLLTHKSPQMTMRYSHLRDHALKDAAAVQDEIINQVINGD